MRKSDQRADGKRRFEAERYVDNKIPASPSANANALFVASSLPMSAPIWSVFSNFNPASGIAFVNVALILSAVP